MGIKHEINMKLNMELNMSEKSTRNSLFMSLEKVSVQSKAWAPSRLKGRKETKTWEG